MLICAARQQAIIPLVFTICALKDVKNIFPESILIHRILFPRQRLPVRKCVTSPVNAKM